MKFNYPYLKDNNFLKYLTSLKISSFFTNINILNWNEQSISAIQGKVVSANFTIDGKSSLRRTGNLSFQADENFMKVSNAKNLISINKKVSVQIGIVNDTKYYTNYPILWFPLGIYVIIQPSISRSAGGTVINLQLKDKMCLLNGECGGTLSASTVFDNYETVDENGDWVIKRPTIYQIIFQLVNHFGGQQLGKIVISDLDTRIKQVVKWTGESPLFFLEKEGQYFLTTDIYDYQDKLTEGWVNIDGSPFEYGRDVGYIFTDFTYPGDLIGNAGDSIVSILDKIKGVLTNYEYFYDINGNFVFQEIKNYLNNSQSKYLLESFTNEKFLPEYISNLPNNNDEDAYLINTSNGKSIFSFNDSNLISSYTNSPNYSIIKNDFIVWGLKGSNSSNNKFPIRYHLAIDKKPSIGNTYEVFKYTDEQDGLQKWHSPIKYNSFSQFPTTGVVNVFYMDRSTNKIYKWGIVSSTYGYIEIEDITLQQITTTDWRTQLYFQGVIAEPYGTDSNFYYKELLNEWPKIYDIQNGRFKEEYLKNSTLIDYYLDFIDTNSSIQEFSIQNIGRRTSVLNENDNVNCIFQPYIPDIVFINIKDDKQVTDKTPEDLRQQCERRKQNYHQVNDEIYLNLAAGGSMNSAYQVIRQLIHYYTRYNNSITIQTLPMFFLQPNTRITVNDSQSDIYGDYMIEQLSFSLDTSSMLTINATKAIEKI